MQHECTGLAEWTTSKYLKVGGLYTALGLKNRRKIKQMCAVGDTIAYCLLPMGGIVVAVLNIHPDFRGKKLPRQLKQQQSR